MTISELRDSTTHDVEAEAEKEITVPQHSAHTHGMKHTPALDHASLVAAVKKVMAEQAEPIDPALLGLMIAKTKEIWTAQHEIAGAHKTAGNANHGAQVTQDSLTTVEPRLTTVKKVRAGETNAVSGPVNERPSAEVGCGRLHQKFAAYTAAEKTRGSKATLQIVSPPPQQKLSLTQQQRRSVHRAQAAKRARRPTQLLFDQDTLVAKMKEMLAAQDEAAHAEASDGNTKRVRSDKGTRAVLHALCMASTHHSTTRLAFAGGAKGETRQHGNRTQQCGAEPVDSQESF